MATHILIIQLSHIFKETIKFLFHYLKITKTEQVSHKKYFLLTVEINYHNVKIDESNFYDQPTENDIKTF